MLKYKLVSNSIQYNTHSFLLTRLIYTATVSVKFLVPQIYNMQL